MPFRIDLGTKNNTHVFLQVVRNQINVYFQGSDAAQAEEPYQTRANFSHLLEHFELENRHNMIRGKDPEHVKRHHSHMEETKIPHLHLGFMHDVTPEILAQFLKGILTAQQDHSGEAQYQFISSIQADDILRTFTSYYQDYQGSQVQQQYLNDCQLTHEEKIRLKNAASSLSFFDSGSLTQADEQELEKCGIEAPKEKQRKEIIIDPEVLVLFSMFSQAFDPSQKVSGYNTTIKFV